MSRYVLITCAHNEASFVESTFRSINEQTMPPLKWIVVNDASTDATAAVLERCRGLRPDLIEVVHRQRPAGRDFGNKVRAFNAGLERTVGLDHEFIANVDADITLPADYYERIIEFFDKDPRLGIAGGMVCTRIDNRFVSQQVASDSVAGAVQMFRRECFDAIGGYLALPNGGVDSAAEILARQSGWRVRTFEHLRVLEHRRTGSATASPLKARIKEGRRLHSLGYGFVFFLVRCLRRSMEPPRLVGSLAALWGFLGARLCGEPVALPPSVVSFLRREQRNKLMRVLGLPSLHRRS